MEKRPLKLLIAIPALNEEASIAGTLERALAARARLVAESPVTQVEVVVVSDGSTDRTAARARAFSDARLITFPENRGYGAAIKAAWASSDAALLGFMDADGTCDPLAFVPLCNLIQRTGADVAVGCRLTHDSQMPWLRRAGNLAFAVLLSFLSSRRVRDTASGMRVVRASSLPKLYPLPDGMHFTPAMSARALLSPELSICELEVPYREREGVSKLHLIRDGLKFLRVIVEAAFLYRPSRPLGMLARLCAALTVLLMAMPVAYYLRHRQVLEWMIYRFIVAHLLGTSAVLLGCASQLSRRVVDIVLHRREAPSLWQRALTSRWFYLLPVGLFGAGGWLVLPSFVQLVRTGHTDAHWSRFIPMSALYASGLALLTARTMNYALDLLEARVDYLKGGSAP